MRLDTPRGPVWLGYCSNVLPITDAGSVERAIRDVSVPLARRLAPVGPIGVGLHLTGRAARELSFGERRLDDLRRLLLESDLHPFTVNAFPMGAFHADCVKDAVYWPDWTTAARYEHTMRVARVLAGLLGPGETGTISTVAGSFKPWGHGTEVEERVAAAWTRTAHDLSRLRDDTGRRIVLCPEPEPLTTLETTEEVVAFWERRLDRGDPRVRDHLAICFDCCHQAVQHEDLPASVARLEEAGVPIGKVHVSSALVVDPSDAGAIEALREFDEPRYLHQVVAPDGRGGLVRCADLATVLEDPETWRPRRPWRIHFHVPIEREAIPPLSTTRSDLKAGVRAIVDGGLCDHFEVETYTWSVLPGPDRPETPADLMDGLARELEYARSLIAPGR
jgi:hypothetical protein